MRRVFALALTILLSVQIAGFYLFLAGRLAYLHAQSRVLLRQKPIELLERIELSEPEYRQVRVNEREIKVNGKMYDIGRLERMGGRVIVYAEHDKAEDNLMAFIHEILKRAAADDSPLPAQLGKLLSLHYVPAALMGLYTRGYEVLVHRFFFDSRLSLFSTVQDTPPPEA